MKAATGKKSSMLDKIREEQARIAKKKESQGGFEKIDWYKPEEGDNLIRILPAVKADDLPFKVVHLHYISIKKRDGGIVNGIPVRCHEDFGEECPICAAVRELYSGSEKQKETAKQIRAREVYLYNIINFKDRKVQPYAAGITVHEEILTYAGDVGLGIFSEDGGHNWKVTKKIDPRKPKNLGIKYSVRMDIKESDIPSKLKVLLENATDLDSLYADKEMANVNAYLESIGMEGGEEEDEDEIDTRKAAPKAKAKAKAVVEEEEDEEDEYEEVKPKAKAKVKAKAVVEEDDEEEEYEEVKPKAKAKAKAKAVVEEDEDEDEDESEDDEFEKELRELGM